MASASVRSAMCACYDRSVVCFIWGLMRDVARNWRNPSFPRNPRYVPTFPNESVSLLRQALRFEMFDDA